jgi:hypothetical protein
MKIATNEKLINRNRRIAQIASIAGLVILVGGMIISFQRQELINFSFAALIIGFILSQVGIYFTNRWGRRPRPDEMLNQSLKGLDSKFSIYHYTTPAAHLLVGPAGVWVLMPRQQRGTISIYRGRWKHSGGGVLQTYLKLFGQESLGRPDLEIENEIDHLKKYLQRKMPDQELPEIQAALIFTHDKVEININGEETPLAPTLHLNKLKEFIRKTAKNKPVSLEKILEIQQTLNLEQPANDQ